jgi:hypothetical protein
MCWILVLNEARVSGAGGFSETFAAARKKYAIPLQMAAKRTAMIIFSVWVNIFHFTSLPVSLSSVIVVFFPTFYVITVAPAEQLERTELR